MRVYGLDFTSAPSSAKPIACAGCVLEEAKRVLRVDGFIALDNFEVFENFLASEGPWVAGLDFPFGQPRRLVTELGWPSDWAGYVEAVAALTMGQFESLLRDYRGQRAPGQKHLLRETDRRARSRSPMMLYGVPVGKMFYRGAPRLLHAGVGVVPCRAERNGRVVVEAYPALVARRWVGARSYKNDTPAKQSATHEAVRRNILQRLRSRALRETYGLELALPEPMAEELAREPSADQLDALLCAVQAAWAWSRRERGFGVPPEADPNEGWIVDPGLA